MRAIPDEVERLLGSLVPDLAGALGDDAIGIYLTGSAASAGYEPGTSDVDLVVVAARPAAELDLDALNRVHWATVERDSGWDDRLEIVYIGRTTLAAFRATTDELAVISPGEPFHLTGPVSDWLQNWYLVATAGRVLLGPPATEIFPSIAPAEFLAAIRAYARYLAASAPGWSGGRLAYAVVSVCRALATIRAGGPCTKRDGAAVVRRLRPQDADLIDAALDARGDVPGAPFDAAELRARAVRFVTELIEEIEASPVS
jgi:hypothetical protein